MSEHQPVDIQLHQQSRVLEVSFESGESFQMTCEYLRVFSPSAEVMGHGIGEGKLQVGKEDVNIISIEPVGNYAIRLVYDDGHSSGIYSWDYLYQLGASQLQNWQRYLARLAEAGFERKMDRLS
ncbi:MAG: gamma-butyrobetaine hydroxylase-like domain-containing protein [Candidatus Oxydemutatoraceae bacterium WSBS_2016_MAG_OTU14]